MVLNNYYRDHAMRNNDIRCDTVPLQLNCAGIEHHDRPRTANTVRQDYYLFYMREGATRVEAPINALLRAGDMIIFEPGCPFKFHTEGEDPTVHYFAHFTGYLSTELLSTCRLSTNTVYSVGISGQIASKFQTVFRTFLIRDGFFDLDSSNKMTDLLLTLGRYAESSPKGKAKGKRRHLEKSLAYIHDNFTSPISVPELAKLEFLSESRYRAVFFSALKQSPTEYIINLRMEAACNLLSQTDMNITEISAKVGYPDSRYFSRLFRKRNNMTPSEYRDSFES